MSTSFEANSLRGAARAQTAVPNRPFQSLLTIVGSGGIDDPSPH